MKQTMIALKQAQAMEQLAESMKRVEEKLDQVLGAKKGKATKAEPEPEQSTQGETAQA